MTQVPATPTASPAAPPVLLPHEAVAAVLALPQEQLAAGLVASPSDGVFAAGVLLAEMLTGVAARQRGGGSAEVMEQRFHALPEDWARNLDEPLQAHLHRALHQDPVQRFADVEVFRAALSSWAGTPAARTLETLLARMRTQGDFPALADAMGRILQVAGSDDHSLDDLAREILKDVALTQQLLRLVNSAHYAHAARGAVSTVSRAVSLVGFNGVRNLALSLMLLERMQNPGHAGRLKVQFLRALLAGSIALELCAAPLWREDAFLGAMFQNLGRMLVQFYFPHEAALIRSAEQEGRYSGGEEAAAIHVLGLSLEDFGTGVARTWGLPTDLLYCMRRPFGKPPPRRPHLQREYLRWLAVAANDITSALLGSAPAEPAARVKPVTDRYARVLGLAPGEFADAVAHAQGRLVSLLETMSPELAAQARGLPPLSADSLATQPPVPAPQPAPLARPVTVPVPPVVAEAPAPVPQPAPPPAAGPTAPEAPAAGPPPAPALAGMARMGRQHEALRTLTEGLQATGLEVPLSEVLRQTLAQLRQALAAQRVVFCLRDPATGGLAARHAVGEGSAELLPRFRFEVAGAAHLLATACAQGQQAVVTDASAPSVQERLPAWLRQPAPPGAFWLLPLVHRGAAFALLYADADRPGGLVIDPGSRELLRGLGEALLHQFRLRQARPAQAR